MSSLLVFFVVILVIVILVVLVLFLFLRLFLHVLCLRLCLSLGLLEAAVGARAALGGANGEGVLVVRRGNRIDGERLHLSLATGLI